MRLGKESVTSKEIYCPCPNDQNHARTQRCQIAIVPFDSGDGRVMEACNRGQSLAFLDLVVLDRGMSDRMQTSLGLGFRFFFR